MPVDAVPDLRGRAVQHAWAARLGDQLLLTPEQPCHFPTVRHSFILNVIGYLTKRSVKHVVVQWH